MKHITIAIDDEVYDRASARAAERNMSIPEMVRQYLAGHAADRTGPASPEEFQRLKELEQEITEKIRNFSAGDRLTREELYDRKRS